MTQISLGKEFQPLGGQSRSRSRGAGSGDASSTRFATPRNGASQSGKPALALFMVGFCYGVSLPLVSQVVVDGFAAGTPSVAAHEVALGLEAESVVRVGDSIHVPVSVDLDGG